MCIIMSSVNDDCFTSSPSNIDAFYFSSLIAVFTSIAVFSISGKSGHPCLVPDFSGKTSSFSPLSIMLAVGLL